MKEIMKLQGWDKKEFYQAKYKNYKNFNRGILVASCIVFIVSSFIGYELSGQFEWGSFMLRCIALIPLSGIIFASMKTDDYRIMSVLSFGMVYIFMGCTILKNYYMSDWSHFNEEFLIICITMLLVSFCTPPEYAMVFQWGSVSIFVFVTKAVNFAEYNNSTAVYLFQVALLLCIVDFMATKLYYKQYVLEKKQEWILLHDPLTQVYNRNKLNIIMDAGHNLSSLGVDISILVFDIDHFKKINDNYGHDEGDRVLKLIAATIKKSIRKQDIVIRWGGEEFIAIMPDCKLNQANEIAERVRKKISRLDNGICNVTISVGVAQYDGGDCMETIKRADEALYKAKQDGRNRVVCYA